MLDLLNTRPPFFSLLGSFTNELEGESIFQTTHPSSAEVDVDSSELGDISLSWAWDMLFFGNLFLPYVFPVPEQIQVLDSRRSATSCGRARRSSPTRPVCSRSGPSKPQGRPSGRRRVGMCWANVGGVESEGFKW